MTRTICRQVGLQVRNMLLGTDLENMTDMGIGRGGRSNRCICEADLRIRKPALSLSSVKTVIQSDIWETA